jgi:hypothetical protein
MFRDGMSPIELAPNSAADKQALSFRNCGSFAWPAPLTTNAKIEVSGLRNPWLQPTNLTYDVIILWQFQIQSRS